MRHPVRTIASFVLLSLATVSTEEGFAAMEKALALKDKMFTMALETPGLKIVMGTDAVAGAHGQNIRETIERVKSGQKPMDAIMGVTSLAAESMNLQRSQDRSRRDSRQISSPLAATR